jgi:hypothetical protein
LPLSTIIANTPSRSTDGIPTLATVKRLGIDFPEVIEVLWDAGVKK